MKWDRIQSRSCSRQLALVLATIFSIFTLHFILLTMSWYSTFLNLPFLLKNTIAIIMIK